MSLEPWSAPLARIVARRTGEDGGPKLVHQREVIAVVPISAA
jgi:hypothetical protein